MRVFVTGGTGYLGGPLVRALVAAGHQVTGLARSAEAEARLEALGALPRRGDLTDLASLGEAAAGHEAILHLAQDRDAEDRSAADRAILDALLADARRTGAPVSLVYTSNAFLLGDQGAELDEDDVWPHAPQWGAWRLEVERYALAAATPAIAAAVVRPGQVYGGGAGGTFPMLVEAAGEGAVFYLGEGGNHWPLVHVDDLADLYVRVVEARARGIFHGVADAATTRAIARVVSQAAGAEGRTRSIPVEEARREWGAFAEMLALDVRAAPRRARRLGWNPRRFFPEGVARAYAVASPQ